MARVLKVSVYVVLAIFALGYVIELLGRVGQAAAVQTAAAPEAPACSPAAFQVSDLRGRVEYEYLIITARLRNGCPIAAGVELTTSVFDAQGSLIDTNSSWPASIRNIPAGATESVKIMMRPPQTRKVTFTVEPVATKVWRN